MGSKLLWSVVLFSLFIAVSHAKAAERRLTKQIGTQRWNILFTRDHESGSTMNVYLGEGDRKQKLLRFSPEPVDAVLEKAQQIDLKAFNGPVLLTHWRQGAHAEALRVFEEKDGSLVLIRELHSVYSMQYSVTEGKLRVYLWKKLPDSDDVTMQEVVL